MASLVIDLSLKEKTVNQNWTWKDLKVDIEKTKPLEKDIVDNKDIEAIQGGIYNIFSFRPGERIINPEFGNNLYQYLYEPINNLTADRIGEEVINIFERWEPRVVIQNVRITPFIDEHTYEIEVIYTIPSLVNQTLSFKYTLNSLI